MNKAVFLDRDGVINNDTGHYYIFHKDDFVLNEGLVDALKLLQAAGYLLVVISNQGGVDRQQYTCLDVEMVHLKMSELLQKEGVELAEIYYCPHHNEVQKCLCRKPFNLNIEKAISRFHINRSKSWMVGDSPRDIVAGQASRLNTLKVEANENILPMVKQLLAITQ